MDEIGDLPLNLQANLLHLLQDGTVESHDDKYSKEIDVRVIAATHMDLEKAVAEGLFREDLFYRLNVLRISVPSLKERAADIPELAEHFLLKFARQYNTQRVPSRKRRTKSSPTIAGRVTCVSLSIR